MAKKSKSKIKSSKKNGRISNQRLALWSMTILIVSALLCFTYQLFLSQDKLSKNLAGHWLWVGNLPKVTPPAIGDQTPPSFSLSLVQNNNQISGDFCFISAFASKLDCSGIDAKNDDMSVITGKVKQGMAYLQFKDHRDGETGSAVINLVGKQLFWHLERGTSDSQLPINVYLTNKGA